MKPLRVIDICAGIGGMSLGLEMTAGFETVAFVEIDPYANKILKKHWPTVPRFGDVRCVSAWNLPQCDVLAGGIPCQPHSLAGKRQGADDERDLWPEFYRLICEIRPKYAVVENVPGLRSSDHGRFFGRILRDLAQGGYDAEWISFSAADVGAPHLRERVWIMAYPASHGLHAAQIHYGTSSCKHHMVNMTKGHGLAGLTEQMILMHGLYPTVAFGEWLMGFPQGWTWYRMRCLGNAIVPQCAAVIGGFLLHHHRSQYETENLSSSTPSLASAHD